MKWHLDAQTSALLHTMTGSEDPGEATPVTLFVGDSKDDDGKLVHGLHAYESEYPEEGVIPLVEFPAPAESALGESLRLVLPLAKGYAASNPFGANEAIVSAASLALKLHDAGVPAVVPWLLPDDMQALQRFYETSEDSQPYDVPKDRMRRLAELGAVRWCGASRYEMTAFGQHILDLLPEGWPRLPLKTHADHDADSRTAFNAAHGVGGMPLPSQDTLDSPSFTFPPGVTTPGERRAFIMGVAAGSLGAGKVDEEDFAWARGERPQESVPPGVTEVGPTDAERASRTDAKWVQRLRDTAKHLRENSLSLAKYPGMDEEARARELAALYISEIAELHEAERRLAALGVEGRKP